MSIRLIGFFVAVMLLALQMEFSSCTDLSKLDTTAALEYGRKHPKEKAAIGKILMQDSNKLKGKLCSIKAKTPKSLYLEIFTLFEPAVNFVRIDYTGLSAEEKTGYNTFFVGDVCRKSLKSFEVIGCNFDDLKTAKKFESLTQISLSNSAVGSNKTFADIFPSLNRLTMIHTKSSYTVLTGLSLNELNLVNLPSDFFKPIPNAKPVVASSKKVLLVLNSQIPEDIPFKIRDIESLQIIFDDQLKSFKLLKFLTHVCAMSNILKELSLEVPQSVAFTDESLMLLLKTFPNLQSLSGVNVDAKSNLAVLSEFFKNSRISSMKLNLNSLPKAEVDKLIASHDQESWTQNNGVYTIKSLNGFEKINNYNLNDFKSAKKFDALTDISFKNSAIDNKHQLAKFFPKIDRLTMMNTKSSYTALSGLKLNSLDILYPPSEFFTTIPKSKIDEPTARKLVLVLNSKVAETFPIKFRNVEHLHISLNDQLKTIDLPKFIKNICATHDLKELSLDVPQSVTFTVASLIDLQKTYPNLKTIGGINLVAGTKPDALNEFVNKNGNIVTMKLNLSSLPKAELDKLIASYAQGSWTQSNGVHTIKSFNMVF